MSIREEEEIDIDHITQLHNEVFNEPEEGTIVENLRNNNKLKYMPD